MLNSGQRISVYPEGGCRRLKPALERMDTSYVWLYSHLLQIDGAHAAWMSPCAFQLITTHIFTINIVIIPNQVPMVMMVFWFQKRLCLEAELQLDHHPMETSQSQIAAIQKQEEQVLVRSSPPRATLCCPRCLGGEPGHINHIMGL
ncbi:uncharacterized protein KZ484_009025 isoform 1-T2 [Pholidichthys leucotaenia]